MMLLDNGNVGHTYLVDSEVFLVKSADPRSILKDVLTG